MRQAQPLIITNFAEQIKLFDTIIDVRSPSEFNEDHIPGSMNLPVLTDEQRHDVGLKHKVDGAFAGSLLGAPLVARNIANYLENELADRPRQWRPLIYCWRGGQRSNSLATILARVGWHTHIVEGGYKAYRRFVIDLLADPPAIRFVVLAGRTGTAKSLILQALAQRGEQVLDLEDIALHKGSVLGDLPNIEQPSQKQFESLLFKALNSFDCSRPVFVEAESKKVGKVHIPDGLMENIRNGEVITIDAALAWRVDYLLNDYDYFVKNSAVLFAQVDCLVGLHGNEKISAWKRLAIAGDWRGFVATLLSEHYDPAYDRAINRNYTSRLPDSIVKVEQLGGCAEQINAAVCLAAQSVQKVLSANLKPTRLIVKPTTLPAP
jgi:tRNA 2-selenouridine synthase